MQLLHLFLNCTMNIYLLVEKILTTRYEFNRRTEGEGCGNFELFPH
jgi:hypothetical protein